MIQCTNDTPVSKLMHSMVHVHALAWQLHTISIGTNYQILSSIWAKSQAKSGTTHSNILYHFHFLKYKTLMINLSYTVHEYVVLLLIKSALIFS